MKFFNAVSLKINTLLFKKIDASGLAFFRMFYSVILFLEVAQLYKFRGIIYSEGNFMNMGELDPQVLFFCWFVIILFLFLGLFHRTVSILNYIFSVVIFSSAHQFEYHVFYAYVGINLLLIFMPVSRVISIDNLLLKLKYSSVKNIHRPDRNVMAANYLIPVFIGVGVVYFDSIFYKFTSPMWMKGLGMWLPSNLSMATWTDMSWFMNNKILVKSLGYLTIAFETVFIFLFWFKRFRIILIIIGVGLHLGILIAFPIPWFALTAIALYILMVPVSFWKTIIKRIKFNNPIYYFHYNSEDPTYTDIVAVITHVDIFSSIKCIPIKHENTPSKKNNVWGLDRKNNTFLGYYVYTQLLRSLIFSWPIGILLGLPFISTFGKSIYAFCVKNKSHEKQNLSCNPSHENEDYLIIGLNRLWLSKIFWGSLLVLTILTQGFVSFFSPLPQLVLAKLDWKKSTLNKKAEEIHYRLLSPLVKFFGIAHHPVFMDTHFDGYNHIISVAHKKADGSETFLPIINENGLAGEYIHGTFWVNYTFRVSAPRLNQQTFEKGIIPYLNYYRNKDAVWESGDSFVFYVRNITIPDDWKENFLHEQMKQPWKKAGSYVLSMDGGSGFYWNDLMLEIFESEKPHHRK